MNARAAIVGLALLCSLTVGPGAWASAPSSRPCGVVDVSYWPHRVSPGQFKSMELTVGNCSESFEALELRARTKGPCPFVHPANATYELGAGMAVTEFADFLAPDCPGTYAVRAAVFLQGHLLDQDQAGFDVVTRPDS